jgi:hypothetical protein
VTQIIVPFATPVVGREAIVNCAGVPGVAHADPSLTLKRCPRGADLS